ncbi:MAG: OsmC family protein [Chitinophagaceae bacterium]
MTASIVYEGNLRCSVTHVQSGTVIETDAPIDNRGKGERFSPTDTVCVALGTCIITTMGIKASDLGIDLSGAKLQVTKHMLHEPRRIGAIDVILDFPTTLNVSEDQQKLLQKIGYNCPVVKSLNEGMKINVVYNW